MKFKQVRIKNFKSIGEATIDLDKRGLVLIEGINQLPSAAIDKNGAGKSSALSSIFYALYGELPNGDKADAVVNAKVGKNTLVELDIETTEGKFTVARGRKKNVLTIVSGDKEFTKGTIKETQAVLDDLVKIPKDVFLSTLYFDGHNSQSFSTLTDKQRKEYLETLFDVGIYRDAHEQTKTDLADKNVELNGVNALIKTNEVHKEALVNNFSQLKEEKESFNNTLLGLANDVKEKEMSLSELIEKNKPEIEELTNKGKSLRDVYNSYATPNPNLSKVQDEYAAINNGKNALDVDISSIKATIKNKKELMDNLSVSERCLVCGNLIDEEHKNKEIANIKNALLPLINDFKDKSGKLASYADELPKVKEQVDALSQEESSRNENQWKVKSAMDDLARDIKQLQSNEQQLSREVDSAKSYENKFRSSNSNLDENIKKVDEDIKKVDKDTTELYDKQKALVAEVYSLEKALMAFSDKGIKSHVLDLVTPEMNNTIQSYLSRLTGGSISVTFSTQGTKANGDPVDKFDIKVINDGQETTYNSLSSGEQRRVDVAISLTLQDILMRKSNTQSNILIYDELFESLDAVGSESIIELLKERLNEVSSIFVVTHNDMLKPLFDNMITVIKEDTGISRVDNGEVSS